jgi:nucleotide-binding universal stress UspA family protein
MSRYVVGTDGSETAKKAADRAAELAQATGASIHVVCAYTDRGSTKVGLGSDVYVISAVDEADQIAEDQASRFRLAGITTTVAAVEGKPGSVILDEAARVDADLIVVGNRRMQGVQRILGAVANDVAHHAPCDVLIVKTV